MRNLSVQVTAVTEGIRSFTTTPYVFLNIDRARGYTGTASDEASYFLVRLQPKADLEQVRRNLLANISDVEVLTSAEFGDRSRSFWLFSTGAGAALFAGALLGVIVGTVIVAQTLYSSTKDHLNEFATLARDRLVAALHLQGDRLAGAGQRGDRLRDRDADRYAVVHAHRGDRAADHDHAWIDRGVCSRLPSSCASARPLPRSSR